MGVGIARRCRTRALSAHARVQARVCVHTSTEHKFECLRVRVHVCTRYKAGPEHCTVRKNMKRLRQHTVGELTRVFGELSEFVDRGDTVTIAMGSVHGSCIGWTNRGARTQRLMF